jgi:hypothetical protein
MRTSMLSGSACWLALLIASCTIDTAPCASSPERAVAPALVSAM